MITRQLNLKTLQRIKPKQILKFFFFHSLKHEHHLFDESPQPDADAAASVNRSMLNMMHTNDAPAALRFFCKQIQLCSSSFRSNIDEVSVTLGVKACQGDLKLGCQVHGHILTSGFASCLTVSNSLMSMYIKGGKFESALCIFDTMCYTDVVSWNTILSGFQTSEGALGFALRMHRNGIAFDPVTCSTVLAFCAAEYRDFVVGLQLHCLIFKSGLDCEVFVGNALISMYSRWRQLGDAAKVFDEMRKRDVVSWNAILSGYSQEGNHGHEALSIFVEMVRIGMKLDHVSFTGAVSACGHEKNLQLGRQIHGLTVKSGYETHASVGNVLISTYSKSGVTEDAKLVFRFMTNRNVIAWTTMISMDEENAMSLFNAMRLAGVYPNDVTFVGLIHAISARKLVEGLMIHGFCKKTGFLSKINVCNSFITMYAKFESMDNSVKVFEELNYREIISWNALISGYAQNRLCQDALKTFLSATMEATPNNYTFGSVLSAIGDAHDISLKYGQQCHSFLIKLGSVTDPITAGALLDMYAKRGSICESQRVFNETPHKSQFAWTAIISAYAGHGDYDSVIELFYQMDKEGVRPDSITFLSVLSACSRKGSVEMGRHFFKSMKKDYLIEPSPQHYACMVDMLGRAGKLEEAEDLTGQMSGQPTFSLLQSLLGACTIHGNVEMAERVAAALMQMEPTESGSYVLLSNLYAEKGDWDMVAKIRKQMRDRGVRKEVGFSWLDNGDADGSLYLHGFSSGDNSHRQSEEISRMAKCIGLEMKFLKENMSEIDSLKLEY